MSEAQDHMPARFKTFPPRHTHTHILSLDLSLSLPSHVCCSNPTFAESRDGRYKGIGSVHMREAIQNNIWPMSLVIQVKCSKAKRRERVARL